MTKKKINELIDNIEIYENGFDYGLKSRDIIIARSVTNEISFIKDKKKFAKELVARLKGVKDESKN